MSIDLILKIKKKNNYKTKPIQLIKVFPIIKSYTGAKMHIQYFRKGCDHQLKTFV